MTLDYGYYVQAMTGNPRECGDACWFHETRDYLYGVHLDILGHGREANDLADQMVSFFQKAFHEDLEVFIKSIHRTFRQSRGGMLTLYSLEKNTGRLVHMGVGNISGIILGSEDKRLFTPDGILGNTSLHYRINYEVLNKGDILISTSDGIQCRRSSNQLKKLLHLEAEVVAKEVVKRFGKDYDDKSCMVIKY